MDVLLKLVELVNFSRVSLTWQTFFIVLFVVALFHGKGLLKCTLGSVLVASIIVASTKLLPFYFDASRADRFKILYSSHPDIAKAVIMGWISDVIIPCVITVVIFGVLSILKARFRR